MTAPFQWHDMARKSFSSVEDARINMTLCIGMMRRAVDAVFARKLGAGFEVVEPLTIQYVQIVEVIEATGINGKAYPAGSVYVEMRSIATIKDKKT